MGWARYMRGRNVTPLTEVRAEDVSRGARLSWRSDCHEPPHVRALRSTQWYPQSPDDAASGAWCAEIVHDSAVGSFADGSLAGDTEYFYSLFARRRDGSWYDPVHIRAYPPDAAGAGPEGGAVQSGHTWQIAGDLPPTRGTEQRTATLTVIFPAIFVPATVLAAATSGLSYRASLAFVVAIVIAWRFSEPADCALRYFLGWLAVPTVIVAAVALGKLTMFFWLMRLAPDAHYAGPLEIVWFTLQTAALAGYWLFATYMLVVHSDSDRRLRAVILGAPILLAFVLPWAALIAGSAVAVTAVYWMRQVQHPFNPRWDR